MVHKIAIDADQLHSTNVESGVSNLICTCPKPVMVPAGTLVHLVPQKGHDHNKNKSSDQSTYKQSTNPRYILKVVDDVAEFSAIKVCPNLLSDHSCQAYINGLKDIAENYATNISTK